jgi:predicted dehydrogenase
MNTYKNVGLIECNYGPLPELSEKSKLNGYNIKKIYTSNNLSQNEIREQFPYAEIVDNTKSIIDDALIDLVIVSSPTHSDMDIVGEVLEAGKNVRVI